MSSLQAQLPPSFVLPSSPSPRRQQVRRRPRLPRRAPGYHVRRVQLTLPLSRSFRLPCLAMALPPRRVGHHRDFLPPPQSSILSSLPPVEVLRRRLSRLHVAPTRGPGSFPPWAAPPNPSGVTRRRNPRGAIRYRAVGSQPRRFFFLFSRPQERETRGREGRQHVPGSHAVAPFALPCVALVARLTASCGIQAATSLHGLLLGLSHRS